MKTYVNVTQGLLVAPDGSDWPVLGEKDLEPADASRYLAYSSIQESGAQKAPPAFVPNPKKEPPVSQVLNLPVGDQS
jgi:hypothetical protein